MIGFDDQQGSRLHVGLAFLLLGALLLAWAWGSWTYRTTATNSAAVGPAHVSGEGVQTHAARNVLPWVLLATLVLVLTFLFGSLALRRWSRRVREAALSSGPMATASDDVWNMHQLAPSADEDDLDEPMPQSGGM